MATRITLTQLKKLVKSIVTEQTIQPKAVKRTPVYESRYSEKRFRMLLEAKDDSMAEYEYTVNGVIAKLKMQKASAFTKLADKIVELDEKVSVLDAKRAELYKIYLAAQKDAKSVEDLATDMRDELRQKIIDIFDDSDKAMSLTVKCLNSSFNVAVKTKENEPTIRYAGEVESVNYEQVIKLLMEQYPDLGDHINDLIKQCTTFAQVDKVIKAGKRRALTINTTNEAVNFKGLWEKIVSTYTTIKNKIIDGFARLSKRQNKIDELIAKMG